jgi:hypothetical protein
MAAYAGKILRTFTSNWDDFQRKRLMGEIFIAWELVNEFSGYTSTPKQSIG